METDARPQLDFSGLTAPEIDALLDDLEPEEHELSAKRRRAHERIDNLRADVRAGVDSGAALARLEVWERRLSAERRALHACIDALYEARDGTDAPRARPSMRTGGREHGATLVDPDAGRHGTLGHLPSLERPLGDRVTLGYGPRRLDPTERPTRLERPDR